MSERLDVSLPLMKMSPNEQVKETQRLTQVAADPPAPPDSSPTLTTWITIVPLLRWTSTPGQISVPDMDLATIGHCP
jgi:hypothetical protein